MMSNMSELRELYQEMIIDHGRHPRNFGVLDNATHHQEGFNPLCGDKIVLYIKENQGNIEKITFEGCGCAISMASASLMTEIVSHKTREQCQELFAAFHELTTQGTLNECLGKLAIFAGVWEFPARVKCATLAWHTLRAALAGYQRVISTEENV